MEVITYCLIETGAKEGFEKYELRYHNFETENKNGLEMDDIMPFCEVDINKMREVAGVVDTYIEQKVSSGLDINHVEADEIFDKDEFITIIKSYGDNVEVPAICYWETLKQAFVEYRDFENTYNGDKLEQSERHTKHSKRVRMVTEMLVSLWPSVRFARWGYQLVTGKEPEVLETIDKSISEKIVNVSDATVYLAASAGLGCLKVMENAVESGAATIEFLRNNQENAEKIMSLDITGDLKNELDKLYGRDNWVSAISGSVEQFGTTATYIGLTMLFSMGGIQAIAGGVGLVLGKSGEIMKQDISKTGKLTSKEMVHGFAVGAIMLGCAELGVQLHRTWKKRSYLCMQRE